LSFGPARAADVDDLIGKMKDKDTDTRRQAARALSDAGVEAKAAVPALQKAGLEIVFNQDYAADIKDMTPLLSPVSHRAATSMQRCFIRALFPAHVPQPH